METETTRLALEATGQDVSFITCELLNRPTFPFLRAIVRLFCVDLHFAEGLYTNKELGLHDEDAGDDDLVEPTRKDKITFLVKILAVVSALTGERHDILVSPAKVLSGLEVEVPATQRFLRTLASRACHVPPEQSKEAAARVLATGETALYRQGVRTRNAFVKVQALWRGRLVRRLDGPRIEGERNAEPIDDNESPPADAAPAVALDISDDELSDEDEDETDEISCEHNQQDGNDSIEQELETEPESSPTIASPEMEQEVHASPSPASSSIPSSPPKVYVGLDGKRKAVVKEPTVTERSSSSSGANDVEPKAPQHELTETRQRKASVPRRRPVSARIRSTRPSKTADACTSVELDNAEMSRDMSELHMKQLQHREAVEVFRKAEVNLKVRVQHASAKESELKQKEAELKEREERVLRVSENLRKQQQILRQQQEAIKADSNGRPLGSLAAKKAKDEPKPPLDPNIAAEIKGLRRKLFRSERRVQRREDQIRALAKRLGRLKKLHQRTIEEAKMNDHGAGEDSDRSSWLVELSTNNSSKKGADNGNKKKKKAKVPSIGTDRKRELQTKKEPSRPANKEVTSTSTSDEPPKEQHKETNPSGGKEEQQCEAKEGDAPPTKPSVSFNPNVEVNTIGRLPPPPSPVYTPTRTRRAAYMQQAKADIVPLSSSTIRQSLSKGG